MRSVDRTAVSGPPSLMDADGAGVKELKKARTFYAAVPAPVSAYAFTAYKGSDVRQALETLFHGKCAYCEARYDVSGPVDIEHFRPKGGVDGVPDHAGYWWLAATWSNLLPSCLDCNRRRYQPTPEALASLSGVLDQLRTKGFRRIATGKESCFPIAGVRLTREPADPQTAKAALAAEEAVLLEPTSDDPARHLEHFLDRDRPLGLVFAAPTTDLVPAALPLLSPDVVEVENAARHAGVSVKGAVSIQVYGLNRLSLVQERTRVLRRLEYLVDVIIQVSKSADELETVTVGGRDARVIRQSIKRLRAIASRTLAEIRAMAAPEAPFTSMVAAWIKRLRADLEAS